MPSDGQAKIPPEFNPEDEIDQLFGRANPNPERVGCPPSDILSSLARKDRPIEDPAWEHLAKCSPCYQEWRALQQQFQVAPAAGSRAALRMLAVAAALAVIAGGTWFFIQNRPAVRDAPEIARRKIEGPALRAKLDLRPFSVSRSDAVSAAAKPMPLRRGILSATILLPAGAQPGPYEVRLVDEALQSKAEATGQATIVEFVTTIAVRLDLKSVEAGRYQLALRRTGESWRLFPVVLE